MGSRSPSSLSTTGQSCPGPDGRSGLAGQRASRSGRAGGLGRRPGGRRSPATAPIFGLPWQPAD
eukprot:6953486-Alexandrium_andersonii.AAC.1